MIEFKLISGCRVFLDVSAIWGIFEMEKGKWSILTLDKIRFEVNEETALSIVDIKQLGFDDYSDPPSLKDIEQRTDEDGEPLEDWEIDPNDWKSN